VTAVPDGVEVVRTSAESDALQLPALLVVDEVERFLDEQGLGHGPLHWERIGDGQSNVTFRIDREGSSWVLRRGPRPPLPRSAHDMVREARLLKALRAAGAPVPEILAVCKDERVLGVNFYVMSMVDGFVALDSVPPALDTEAGRRGVSLTLVDTLVGLHAIDIEATRIAAFGRPAGYLQRQVARFASLWEVNSTRVLPDVDRLAGWLADNVPRSADATVVHGDYRLGNILLERTAPARVAAVLDWELATVGDPLADLGYLVATYSDPGSEDSFMELSPVTRRPGFLTRDELIAEYGRATGRDLRALPWYWTLALWKSAIFSEAIYTRWRNGERPDDTTFGPSLEHGIPAILAEARRTAGI